MSTEALLILIAGPYRSGTEGDPARIAANVQAMTHTALEVYRLGHVPMLGEWLALPLIELAGPAEPGDARFEEIFHPSAERLLAKCDACLRIGGASAGADRMVEAARTMGKRVYHALADLPPC